MHERNLSDFHKVNVEHNERELTVYTNPLPKFKKETDGRTLTSRARYLTETVAEDTITGEAISVTSNLRQKVIQALLADLNLEPPIVGLESEVEQYGYTEALED